MALAAGAIPGEAAESRLQRILDRGVLRAGTTRDWNPMTIRDPATNSDKGYAIDMLTELATALGVRIEVVAADWKTLVPGIQADEHDITGSASPSPARAKVAGFSDPYFELATAPLTLKNNAARFKDWADLDKPDLTVAAALGTVQEQRGKRFFPKAKHKIAQAPARAFQEVLVGRADAHITSNVEAATLVERDPERMILPVGAPRARSPIAMMPAQDDPVWINSVNCWIRLKRARGLFDELARTSQLRNEGTAAKAGDP